MENTESMALQLPVVLVHLESRYVKKPNVFFKKKHLGENKQGMVSV